MPLHRRLPKRGFTNIFRKEYAEINLDRIGKISQEEIGPREFVEAGLLKKKDAAIKILGRGELSSSKKIRAHKFSQAARQKIEKAGGQAVIIGSE
jgi:large subunit ribosomal protein L15